MLACFASMILLAGPAPETRRLEERTPVITLEVVPSPGRPTRLVARFHNRGDVPVWWNARALLNRPHAPAPFRELWLDVTADDGAKVPFNCKVNAGEASIDDYEVLAPGATREVAINLEQCHDLTGGVRFRVVLHYRDGNPAPPPAPAGAAALTAALVSAPVTVERPPLTQGGSR